MNAYWRLSAVYFFFFALLGVQAPYWAPYLAERGFSPVEIGQLLAILMVARVAAPLLWQGGLSRRLSVRHSIWLANGLTLLCFTGVFLDSGFFWLALVMALFGFFWNAVLPLYEAFTLSWLERDSSRYSHIRLWGSLGFIVSVVLVGALLDHWGALGVPWIMFGLIALVCVSGFILPTGRSELAVHSEGEAFWHGFKSADCLLFFALSALMQFVHGPYYSFYSIHLQTLGFSGIEIGVFWALGVLVEIAFFWWAPSLLPRIRVRSLLFWAFVLAALRWLLIGLSDQLSFLLLAQCLHAATYACFHVGAMAFIQRRFGDRRGVRAQAVYGGLSFGGGSALGALAAGYLWGAGGAALAFSLAALLSLLGAVLVRSLPEPVAKEVT